VGVQKTGDPNVTLLDKAPLQVQEDEEAGAGNAAGAAAA